MLELFVTACKEKTDPSEKCCVLQEMLCLIWNEWCPTQMIALKCLPMKNYKFYPFIVMISIKRNNGC